jgi:DNA repair exonuclease SbcCD nuclease subunit
MKLLVWSDLHAHDWKNVDKPDRWKDCIRAIKLVYSVAWAHEVHAIAFLGDLFESKRIVHTHVLRAVVDALLGGPTIPKIFVPGNHDLVEGGSILDILQSDEIYVTSKPKTHLVRGWRVHCVPFGANPTDDYDIMLTHAEWKGAVYETGQVASATTLDEALVAKHNNGGLVMSGHHHKPQRLERNEFQVICVGAPMRHSWRDCDDLTPRGCMLATLNDNVKHAVKAATLRSISFDNELPLFVSDPTGNEKDFCLGTKPQPLHEETTQEITRAVRFAPLAEAVPEYVRANCPDKARHKQLVEVGRKILRAVRKDEHV